jgi:hypothetical protein
MDYPLKNLGVDGRIITLRYAQTERLARIFPRLDGLVEHPMPCLPVVIPVNARRA